MSWSRRSPRRPPSGGWCGVSCYDCHDGPSGFHAVGWELPEQHGAAVVSAEIAASPIYLHPLSEFSSQITLRNRHLAEGQQVEIFIDGELVGTSTVDEEGEFRFISSIAPREYSEVQGEALVDFENDSLLQIAHQQLLEQVAASAN